MAGEANSSGYLLKSHLKSLQIRVEMLDTTFQHFQLHPRSSGQDLYVTLMDRLGVLEAEYFDLAFFNKDGILCWLDHIKLLCKQHNANKEFLFTFCVKFYAPHPNLLEDEYTRYLFALQIKKDLYSGSLQCSENTAALLAAFIAQADLGDFLEDTYLDRSYLNGLRLVPSPTPAFLDKVMECHRSLVGQSPEEADISLLDTVRKVEMYGVRLRPVKGSDGMSLSLAVSHAGLLVFHETSKVNTFSWARIRKLSFKRKKFFIKLHPEGYDAVEFVFDSRNECKNFWKQCIEHHAFFRCQAVKHLRKRKGIGVPKGSSFRYLGRTQNQLREVVRENTRKLGPYDRSASTGRVPAHRSPSLSMSGGVGHNRRHHGTLSSTAVNQLDPSQSIGSGSLTCADDSMVMQQAASSSSTPGGAQCLVRSLASISSNATRPLSPSSSPQDGLPGAAPVLQKSNGSSQRPPSVTAAYVQLPQGSLRGAPYGQRVMLLMRPGVAGAAGGVSIVPLVGSAAAGPAGSSAQVLTTRAMDGTSATAAATAQASVCGGTTSASGAAKEVAAQRPDFLVMLPTQPVHPAARDAADQRIGINSDRRCATPDCVAAMHSSLLLNRTRNGAPLPNVATGGEAAIYPQLGHSVSPQPHAHLASGIRLVPSNLLAAAPGLSSACAVLPSQRSAGRVFYVDSATGRLLSDGQFVAVPPASSLGLLNATASNGNIGPLVSTATAAAAAFAPKSRGAAADLPSAGITLHQAGEDVSTTILHDDATGARCGHALVSIAGAASTTTMASSLGFDPTGDALVGSIGRATGNLRPRGAPPPAPERRDSVRPREGLDNSEATAGAVPTRMDDAVATKSQEEGGGGDDKRSRRELPPPPLPEPDPAHPYPFNVIPVNFFAQRSFEASCLSLAARSTRSSCQSIVDETNIEDEASTTAASQPVRLRRRRRRSELPSAAGDEVGGAARVVSVEGSDSSRPISRSASLHRSSGSASSRSLNATGERASITQDDMAIGGGGGGGEARHVRCHSVVNSALSSVDVQKTPLVPVSKTSRHRASGSNSRRSSVSSSHHAPREPMSMAYHLLRELTMTERTYRKDLDVVCANFCSANLSGQSIADSDAPAVRPVLNRLLTLLEPIRSHHTDFLRGLEFRFSNWSGQSTSRKSVDVSGGAADPAISTGAANGDTPVSSIRVGDLFVTNLKMLKLYRAYISEVEGLLMDLERLARSRPAFGQKIQEIESQKFCYLPFYAFLLKPMHRLLQYRAILERLMRQYSESHVDMQDCRVAHARLLDTIQSQWDSYKRSENLYKILEVERDLVGLQTLPAPAKAGAAAPPPSATATESADAEVGWLARPSRQFVREGLLQKLSKRGYQQRIFFLFSDQLIYASRTNASFLQFKVHGQFHLRDVMVEEAETPLSFTIYSGNRCFLVAAPSEWQRDRWLEDISRAILAAKTNRFASPLTPFNAALLGEAAAAAAAGAADGGGSSQNDLRAVNMQEEEEDEEASTAAAGGSGGGAAANRSAGSAEGSHTGTTAPQHDVSMILHRATTSVHVCWHRSLTFSMSDILRANEYETSGYLLRKFKNSNGWQRLWVVFTQLCMFFHKSCHDTFPLASLPLLGYTITVPEPEDQIRKDFVFKLKFKNHVYFFRDDSQSSFDRWLDCLSSAAENTARQRVSTVRSLPPPPANSSS